MLQALVVPLFLASFLLAAACGDDGAVTGEVVFRDGPVDLPEGAVLTVRLEDTSLQDASAALISEQVIENPGRLPAPFRLPYDPDAIEERNEYSLYAAIRHEGRLLYVNDTVHTVLTNGAPNDRDIEVVRVE